MAVVFCLFAGTALAPRLELAGKLRAIAAIVCQINREINDLLASADATHAR